MLRTTVKEGMDFGDIKGKNYVLDALRVLNKAPDAPGDYLGGPVSFPLVEQRKQISHFL